MDRGKPAGRVKVRVKVGSFVRLSEGTRNVMRRLVALPATAFFVGCLGPSRAPEAQTPTSTQARTSTPAPAPAPWVFELDRGGLVLDGVRVADTDKDTLKSAIYKHWGRDPILEVAPDVSSKSVGRVISGVRQAKIAVLEARTGTFAHEFWTAYLRDDLDKPLLTFHVVGGEVVRFHRFGLPTSATVPGTLERLDWNLRDERSNDELRAWLARNGQPRDALVLTTLEDLPFGEVARVLGRLSEVAPSFSSLRLGLWPVAGKLDAPLETRFGAGSIPPPVVFASMKLVDGDLETCYSRSSDRKTLKVGKIVAKLSIDAAGAVSAAVAPETTIKDPKTLECMLNRIRSVRFPRRDGAPPVEGVQGFFYRSAD